MFSPTASATMSAEEVQLLEAIGHHLPEDDLLRLNILRDRCEFGFPSRKPQESEWKLSGKLIKSEFQMMTMRELKKYVLEHRNDRAAFQALMDRVDAQPQDRVYGEVDADDFSVLLEQHRRAQKD